VAIRRVALVTLIASIIVEILYLTGTFGHVDSFVYNVVVTVLCAALAITRASVRWVATVVRIALGIGFALTICDRYGVFGPYGAQGVSWGDWAHFVAYTHQVNAFLPLSLAPLLASVANVAEIVLAMALILGIATRIATLGAFALLLLYAVAMTVSLGFASQLAYGVIVLCAAALYLSLSDATFLSIDGLVKGRIRTERHAS
jgi:putative oxidoreductase